MQPSATTDRTLVMSRSAVRIRLSAPLHIRSGVKTQSDAKASVWNRSRSYCKMHENLAVYAKLGFEETGRGVDGGYRRVFMRKRPS
jgi:hypothetical protein